MCWYELSYCLWLILINSTVFLQAGHDTWVRSVRFHALGPFLLSVSEDKSIRTWYVLPSYAISHDLLSWNTSGIYAQDDVRTNYTMCTNILSLLWLFIRKFHLLSLEV